MKLAEALDDKASFRWFCCFARHEPTPERTAFVRFRKTLIDAAIIASASKQDVEARFIKHRGKKAVHGYRAHTASDETTDFAEKVHITPANVNDGRPDAMWCRAILARSTPMVLIGGTF